MDPVRDNTERFMALFAGLDRVVGMYDMSNPTPSATKPGKMEGIGLTKHWTVTKKRWETHLKGGLGLGIVPIRDDATVVFGAVDVDVYAEDTDQFLRAAVEQTLPVIPIRSKSGALHFYLFASEPVPALLMRQRLSDIAKCINADGHEIFPKQNKLRSEEDCGCWLNMPYNGETRKATRLNGTFLTQEEFLDFAEAMRQGPEFFATPIKPPGSNVPFHDGPPCLQKLYQIGGFNRGQGMANNLLTACAVYAKKKFGKDWKPELHKINEELFDIPVDGAEVRGVIGSFANRKYHYRCATDPLKEHCDAGTCGMKAFGVGRDNATSGTAKPGEGEANESFPRFTQLSKLLTDPPVWFWTTTTGETLKLTTEQLVDPRKFQVQCAGQLNIVIAIRKKENWDKFVNEAMSARVEIDAPDESSEDGQVMEHLNAFLNGKVQAKQWSEILIRKPFFDKETGVVWFRMMDFQEHLNSNRFRNPPGPGPLTVLFNARKLAHTAKTITTADGRRTTTNLWGMQMTPQAPLVHEIPEAVVNDKPMF